MGRDHAPSRFRAIQREVRRAQADPHGPERKRLRDLIRQAESIDDAGHAAASYTALLDHPELQPATAKDLMDRAVASLQAIKIGWRLVETATMMLRRIDTDADGERAGRTRRKVLDAVLDLPDGDVLFEGLASTSKHVEHDELVRLWERALKVRPAHKATLRTLLRRGYDLGEEPGWLATCENAAHELDEASVRATLLADIARLRGDDTHTEDLDQAAARSLDDIRAPGERLTALRSLIRPITELGRLDAYEMSIESWDDPTASIEGLLAIATHRDRLGDDDAGHEIERLGSRIATIDDEAERIRILAQWAKAMGHLGDAETARAASTLHDALDGLDDEAPTKLRRRITNTLRDLGLDADGAGPSQEPPAAEGPKDGPKDGPEHDAEATDKPPKKRRRPRHALALCDTYEGHLGKTHLQAVARAAPLCAGFDLDLVLFGFPTADLDDLVERAARETNIGDAGRHVRELRDEGRIHLHHVEGANPPPDASRHGTVVVTTPRPEAARRVYLDESDLRQDDPAGRICLVMGLGRHGLPDGWLSKTPHHYEITGRDVSLETATAMGILADRLGSVPVGRSAPSTQRRTSRPSQPADPSWEPNEPTTPMRERKRIERPRSMESEEDARERDAHPRPRRSGPPRGHPKRGGGRGRGRGKR